MPSTIYLGLVGNKNISVQNEYENNYTFAIKGDINEYKGKIFVPDTIRYIQFSSGTKLAKDENGKFHKWKISDGIYKYTNVDCTNTLVKTEKSFSNDKAEQIKVGDTTVITDKESDEWKNCFDNEKQIYDYRALFKNIDKYNKICINWDLSYYEDDNTINKFVECFQDGTNYKPYNEDNITSGVLNYMSYIINANLKSNNGSKTEISLYIPQGITTDTVYFNGNNSELDIKAIHVPNCIKIAEFGGENSWVANLVGKNLEKWLFKGNSIVPLKISRSLPVEINKIVVDDNNCKKKNTTSVFVTNKGASLNTKIINITENNSLNIDSGVKLVIG